jgi:hypothetical protein
MLRVWLHPALPTPDREAHRNSLLTLPLDFRITNRNADLVVTPPGAGSSAARQVVAGIPTPSDSLDAVTASVVDWDPAIEYVVTWLKQQRQVIVSVHIAAWDVPGASPALPDGLRLAGRLVPAVLEHSWRRVSAGQTVVLGATVCETRIDVTASVGPPGLPRLEARVIGDRFTIDLTVGTGNDARPSEAHINTGDGMVGPSMIYSSAWRAMWLSLAAQNEPARS